MSRSTSLPALHALTHLALGAILGCAPREPIEYLNLVDSFARAAIEAPGEQAPRAEGPARLLFLPAGATLTYSFEAAPRTSLRFDRVALRGDGARLRVAVASNEERDYLETSIDRSARNLEIGLGTAAGQALSLTLSARVDAPADGDGALLAAPALWGEPIERRITPSPRFEPAERPDVVIYLIDTLRRDRLGAYGYERPVSPHIDEFAAGATLYENSFGQSSWTKASVASMWSGVWPPAHGATGWGHRLPESFDTLAERLRDAGYETAAFVTNVNASPSFGLAQGFDHVWYEKKTLSHLVNEEVISYLNGSDRQRPLFLYVHTMDPHAGYRPEEPYRSRFAPTADQMKPWKPRWRWPIENLPFFSDLYDGEIAQNDDAFGSLMRSLDERDLFESSLIVVLSDHGEEFKEHRGWRHGRVLHYGTLDVPMIVKFPGQASGSRSTVPASHVDVLPTVLDVTRLPPATGGDGQSLIDPVPRPVFSHLRLGRAPLQYSVVDGRWKLIQRHDEAVTSKLYDLTEDPGETTDLSERLPVRTAVLEGLLRERLAGTTLGQAEEVELTEDLQRTLRALGYLQ